MVADDSGSDVGDVGAEEWNEENEQDLGDVDEDGHVRKGEAVDEFGMDVELVWEGTTWNRKRAVGFDAGDGGQAQQNKAPVRIRAIDFGVMSMAEVGRMSELEVSSRELYQMPQRNPAPGGCLDSRLGPINKRAVCGTCGAMLQDCIGHFGFIRLHLPVFHIGFFKTIASILGAICKSCARVTLVGEEREALLRRARHPSMSLNLNARGAFFKKILDRAKKSGGQGFCPHCSAQNGPVKKISALKLVHFPYQLKTASKETRGGGQDAGNDAENEEAATAGSKVKKAKGSREDLSVKFKDAIAENPEVSKNAHRAGDDLTPLRVLRLFQRIPDEDVELLDMIPDVTRPEDMILQYLPVPPTCIRPSVCSDLSSGSTEDDLTMKLAEIAHVNTIIGQAISRGHPPNLLMENWEYIQLEVARYINSEAPGLPPSTQPGAKMIRGVSQRLKGKAGRFRGNLSGKRVDFSGRTVISPDPNLRITEVGVPERVAKTLTYPEVVTKHNLRRLKSAVLTGPDSYPGANFIVLSDGVKKFLRYGNREKTAQELAIGSIVERHLIDGDVVLFNRQPSLHRISIMAHRVRISPHRTFRFNECVCAPYNADFDGDEMNLHVPQTEEARAEALELMAVQKNLVTPRNGEPLVAATQDFLTTAFLLTSKDTFMDRFEFCRLVTFMCDGMSRVDIPPPAIIKPARLWSGKQLMGTLLRLSIDDNSLAETITTDCPEKGYSGKKRAVPQMVHNDAFVSVRRGELICGALGKISLGSGSKASLLYRLSRNCGPEAAAKAMCALSKFSSRWLSEQGFSIGVGDVMPSARLANGKRTIVLGGAKILPEALPLIPDIGN